MEYKNTLLGIWGLLGLLLWSVEYFNLFKKPQLFLPIKKATRNKFGKYLKMFIYLVGLTGWLSLSYSLMGPREALSISKNEVEVNDIFFVVDVSRSMLAEDFQPNRLEASKRKISEFIKLRPTDRIGIIIFSERVFTLLPLTTDLKLIEQVIEDINVGYLGSGTNIGDAIGLAVARAAKSETKNKVIILLTDGVSNVDGMTPVQAAEEAATQGVKVYTIGVGGDKDAKIPLGKGIFGMRYQSIPGGSIDVETLKKISEITNGKSYLAQDEAALKEVLEEIEKLEKTKIEAYGQVVFKELFYPFLLLGVLFILVADILRRFALKEIL